MKNSVEEKPVISVDKWYVTPFGLKPEEIESMYPWKYPVYALNRCEVWEMEIFICPGDSLDDNVPYIYLTVYLWIRAESVTDRQIDDWLCSHFEAIEVKSYKKLR